jgi:hypothetical protein
VRAPTDSGKKGDHFLFGEAAGSLSRRCCKLQDKNVEKSASNHQKWHTFAFLLQPSGSILVSIAAINCA